MTRRKIQILRKLNDNRLRVWMSRKDMKVSFRLMQDLYFLDMVEGAALPDVKGAGNFPETNIWRITAKGREWLRANGHT